MGGGCAREHGERRQGDRGAGAAVGGVMRGVLGEDDGASVSRETARGGGTLQRVVASRFGGDG